jgi:hypothetical protein
MGIPDDAETARSYGVTGLQPAFSPLYLPGPADRALGFWPFGPGAWDCGLFGAFGLARDEIFYGRGFFWSQARASSRVWRMPSSCRAWAVSRMCLNFGPGLWPRSMRSLPVRRLFFPSWWRSFDDPPSFCRTQHQTQPHCSKNRGGGQMRRPWSRHESGPSEYSPTPPRVVRDSRHR